MSQYNSNYSQESDSDENYISHNSSYQYSYQSSSKYSKSRPISLNNQSEYNSETDLNDEDWRNFNEMVNNRNVNYSSKASYNNYKSKNSYLNSEIVSNSSSAQQYASLVQKDDAQIFSNNENDETNSDNFVRPTIEDNKDKNEILWNIQSRKLQESEIKNKNIILKQPKRVYATRNIAFGNYEKNKDLIESRFCQKKPPNKNPPDKNAKISNKNFVKGNKKDIGINKTRNYITIMTEKPEFKENFGNEPKDKVEVNEHCKNELRKTIKFADLDVDQEVNFPSPPNLQHLNILSYSDENICQQWKFNDLMHFFKDQDLNTNPLKVQLSQENRKFQTSNIRCYKEQFNAPSKSCQVLPHDESCGKGNLHDNDCKVCISTEPRFKPYTIKDYNKIKNMKTMGGLGPNIGGNDWQEKSNNFNKLKNYGLRANENNLKIMKKCNKPIIIDPQINVDAYNRRVAALIYAKNVPLPKKRVYETPMNSEDNRDQHTRESAILNDLKERHMKEKEIVEKLQQKLHL